MANLFSDLTQLLPHLAKIEGKIQALQLIAKNLDSSQVIINVTFKDNTTVVIDQELIPFNLVMELRTLIGDSIDDYQRQQKSLNDLANGNID